jgi:hypothetical protein
MKNETYSPPVSFSPRGDVQNRRNAVVLNVLAQKMSPHTAVILTVMEGRTVSIGIDDRGAFSSSNYSNSGRLGKSSNNASMFEPSGPF